jgi:hypothetical protein
MPITPARSSEIRSIIDAQGFSTSLQEGAVTSCQVDRIGELALCRFLSVKICSEKIARSDYLAASAFFQMAPVTSLLSISSPDSE